MEEQFASLAGIENKFSSAGDEQEEIAATNEYRISLIQSIRSTHKEESQMILSSDKLL